VASVRRGLWCFILVENSSAAPSTIPLPWVLHCC